MRTEEEQAAANIYRAERPRVEVSGWRCHCGTGGGGFAPIWLSAGDSVSVTCRNGHTSALRFEPEVVK